MPELKSVSVSPGNTKMGAIPSVSLPPVLTCLENVPCAHDCYAVRFCRLRPSVRAAYESNLEIYKENPERFWSEVERAAKMHRFFRFHVAGDIPDRAYYRGMKSVCERCPKTEFLCFTKRHALVTDETDLHGLPPENLHLIFSDWKGMHMENPYRFPTCEVLEKNETPQPGWVLCGGNCTECALTDGGCWSLGFGDTICIPKH